MAERGKASPSKGGKSKGYKGQEVEESNDHMCPEEEGERTKIGEKFKNNETIVKNDLHSERSSVNHRQLERVFIIIISKVDLTTIFKWNRDKRTQVEIILNKTMFLTSCNGIHACRCLCLPNKVTMF